MIACSLSRATLIYNYNSLRVFKLVLNCSAFLNDYAFTGFAEHKRRQ